MKIYYIKIFKTRYSLLFGICKFGFYKYRKAPFSFYFDWILGLGIVALRKWFNWDKVNKMTEKDWFNAFDKIAENVGAKTKD